MAPAQIAELRRALEDGGARYRSELYECAMHGYTMADTAVYDESAGERPYTEVLALLDRTLTSG